MSMSTTHTISETLRQAVDPQRVLHTAQELVAIPSPTRDAAAVSDRLAALLTEAGFTVERPTGGHEAAPAVLARLDSGQPGPTLQMDGHLDTVHLPFVPPALSGDKLTGSGSSDMKAGVACMVEALRALRETGALTAGSVLLSAHDLHEAPWAYGQQLDHLIREGMHGDAVLIPEYMHENLPVIGRGNATWKVHIRRPGPPVHEVMRPGNEPDVIAAGAELVRRLHGLGQHLARKPDPQAGCETVFIGQIHSGEIYNQYPQECWLEGTRRWLPDNTRDQVEREFRNLLDDFQRDTGVLLTDTFQIIRDAFRLDPAAAIVTAFQQAHAEVRGNPLPLGAKPFVDDGNSFFGLAGIPAITHGPRAGGAHTVHEWVEINSLAEVAHVYALTAVLYCTPESKEEARG
jgi:acetylornithine deacetylase/succinyl-diaminopimelate desuccinylase-like protein